MPLKQVQKKASEVKRRRRGDALEKAILEAAILELLDRGYSNFTIEGVAKRAGTSRPVLSRRWKRRNDLAIAAIKRQIEETRIDVSDLGDVREELLSMLRQITARRSMLRQIIISQMADYYREENSSPAKLHAELAKVDNDILQTILARGIARGELAEERLKPRVRGVLGDLARHDAMFTLAQPSEEALIAIVDDIFLPLARKKP